MLVYISAVQTCLPLEGSVLQHCEHILQAPFLQNITLSQSNICRALLEKLKVQVTNLESGVSECLNC